MSPSEAPTALEQLRAHVEWFKQWYGSQWSDKLHAAAGFGSNHIENRLCRQVYTDTRTLRRLSDVKASLQVNAAAGTANDTLPVPLIGRICSECGEPKALKHFASMRQGDKNVRLRRCNSCRGHKQHNTPGVHERRALIEKAKDAVCSRCNQPHPPAANVLVHTRGERACNLSQYRCTATSRIIEEIQRCDVMCANCARLEGIPIGPGRPSLAYLPPARPSADLLPI